jgi:hypothetical protein
MLKIITLILLAFNSTFAWPEEDSFPIELKNTKNISIVLGKAAGNEAAFQVFHEKKKIQTEEGLGTNFQFFQIGEEKKRALVVDLNSDGNQELILRTTQPPLIGSLWVFRWNGSKFVPILTKEKDQYLPLPLESTVIWNGKDQFSFKLGGEDRTYIWSKNRFILKK